MPQHYIGSKIVAATPMTRLAYNQYRGWQLPDDEDGSDEGYLVEYLDGGKPNHPDHDGYISWSPKAQFDAGYLGIGDTSGMPPHKQRMTAELAQLTDRLEKLSTFMNSDAFEGLPETDQGLMAAQTGAMASYTTVLAMRLDRI